MNPNTYIHNDLANILNDERVKKGVKITLYEFYKHQMVLVDFIWKVSTDYNLNVNELIVRYIPDIESQQIETYTFIRSEKFRGDEWVIFLKEDGEERHINVDEIYNDFWLYTINKAD